ncbi:MAG: TonB-dependent receptor, partial [Treponema sp.]|nr:TonB-dependent receptor [Treponema sp.]
LFGGDFRVNGGFPLSRGPFTRFSAGLSYHLLLSYLLSEGADFASTMRIPYQPEHTAGFSAEFAWITKKKNKGALTVSGHYEGRRFTDTGNVNFLPPHFLLNIQVNQQAGENLDFFAVARNVLNASYESFADYPMQGITLTAGLRFKTNFTPKGTK